LQQGFVYIEPYLPKRATRPNDILICHPELGVLIVEVKGHGIEDITRISAGTLFVRTSSGTFEKNAFKQAETAMFDIKTAFERSDGLDMSKWFAPSAENYFISASMPMAPWPSPPPGCGDLNC
jgi:hypothetical protein